MRFIIIWGIILFSCTYEPYKVQHAVPLKIDSLRIDSIINRKYTFQNDTFFRDTIKLKGYDIYLKTIDHDEFVSKFKSIVKNGYSTQDSIFIEKLNNYSYRIHDSTLHIKITNKNEMIYSDSKARIGEYVEYIYVDYLEKLKCHIIHQAADGPGGYMLIRDSVIYLMNNICIDTKWTRLLTYDWTDFATGSGRFKLFDITDGNIQELLTYENDYERRGYFWFINDFHFINNNEGIYIHEILKYGSDFKKNKCYASLKIVKKASP